MPTSIFYLHQPPNFGQILDGNFFYNFWNSNDIYIKLEPRFKLIKRNRQQGQKIRH